MKTLYFNLRHTLLALFSVLLLVSSCSKKDPDPLGQYLGSWSTKDNSGIRITITGSGNSVFIKDFMDADIRATVGSAKLIADNQNIATGLTFQHRDNSVSELYIRNLEGTITGGELTLTYTIYSQSRSATLNQQASNVFKKD